MDDVTGSLKREADVSGAFCTYFCQDLRWDFLIRGPELPILVSDRLETYLKKNTSNKLSNIHSLFQDVSQRSIYPVIHEEVLYDEVCHNGLHRWRKLVWGKHGDVAQRHEGSDELLWDVCIQTTGQRLRAETNKVYIQIDTNIYVKKKNNPATTGNVCSACQTK